MRKRIVALMIGGVTVMNANASDAAPPPGAMRLVAAGGVFEIPPGCTVTCELAADYYRGVVACKDPVAEFGYIAGLLDLAVGVPLRPTDPGAQGSERAAGAQVYWGITSSERVQFCAVVTYSVQESSANVTVAHSFCTASTDPRVRAVAVATVRSFTRRRTAERETCAPEVGR